MTRRRPTKTPSPPVAFIPPYPPSWFDRFTDWVDSFPGPTWGFYLILGVVLTLEITVVHWLQGAYPVGTFATGHILVGGSLAYFLGLMHYTDKAAGSAIVSFRPLLTPAKNVSRPSTEDLSKFAVLSYRLTTLPRRPTLLVTLGGTAFAIAAIARDMTSGTVPGYLEASTGSSLSTAAVLVVFIAVNMLIFPLAYHTVHQLVWVSRIYNEHARINIYQLQPLYALSLPGTTTALGLIFFVYALWALTPARGMSNPFQIGFSLVLTAIAAATFAWPLWGAHRRLVKEKEARLAEASSRFEAATLELHRRLDSGRLVHMDDLNKAVATLEIEQNALRRIPTWPWQPGALRAVVAALLLPVAIWALQTLLGRVFGV